MIHVVADIRMARRPHTHESSLTPTCNTTANISNASSHFNSKMLSGSHHGLAGRYLLSFDHPLKSPCKDGGSYCSQGDGSLVGHGEEL